MNARESFRVALLCAASGTIAGCNAVEDLRASQLTTEDSIAQSCRNWESRARLAAYPDTATKARHDAYAARAEKFRAEAGATRDPEKRREAIEKLTQAEEDAKGVYDWQYDLSVARQCWASLDIVASEHEAQLVRLARLADELAAAPMPSLTSDLAAAAPSVRSPAPPAPPAAPAEVGEQPPTAPKTWMDTPYAPLVPPVYRTEPVDCGAPAIAPVARDCP